MVSLRLVPVSGNPIEVTADPSLVGRDPSCEIVATEGSVSRRHARLERRAGAWWVVDQGSANGTYVNSMKVAETALKNGQELRFGALVYRVEIGEDPDATVASPVVSEETVMAEPSRGAAPPAAPPPVPPAPPPPPDTAPRPSATPPPVPRSSPTPAPPAPPPSPPTPARPRPAGAPVPQMSGGTPPPKKGRGPLFWILVGCCGCLALVILLGGLLGGSVFVMTKGAADATHAWLGDVREGRMDEAATSATDEYRSRMERGEVGSVLSAIEQSTDATLPSRSVNDDRAVLTGVLTGGAEPQAIVIQLVKEGGAWKVDDVRLEDVRSFGQ